MPLKLLFVSSPFLRRRFDDRDKEGLVRPHGWNFLSEQILDFFQGIDIFLTSQADRLA